MSFDKLLYYYQQELAYIRTIGPLFSKAHPQIASYLSLDHNPIGDPHVARIIEAFALANARIRCHEFDCSNEVNDALWQFLHPYAFTTIPAFSIVQFRLPDLGYLPEIKSIPSQTVLRSQPIEGSNCLFTTLYPAQLLPIMIKHAQWWFLDETIPYIHSMAKLQISLTSTHYEKPITASLDEDFLRFYISAPTPYAGLLYEWLFSQELTIMVANGPEDTHPIVLEKNCLRAVGFDLKEALLPYEPARFRDFHLLLDLLVFPKKFFFFDIFSIQEALLQKGQGLDQQLDLFLCGSKCPPALEENLDSTFFSLGCTPIVNIFSQRAEPISLNHQKNEYLIVPDINYPKNSVEIHCLQTVGITSENNTWQECLPFYKTHASHELSANSLSKNQAKYYQLRRKPRDFASAGQSLGSDMYIRVIDKDLNKQSPAFSCLHVDLLCSNADLPSQLPFGPNEPRLYFKNTTSFDFVEIHCLHPFTLSQRPSAIEAQHADYSFLVFNFKELGNTVTGAQAFRAIINACYFFPVTLRTAFLEGLLEVKGNMGSHVYNPDFPSVGEISLIVDDSKFSNGNLYLFGQVLNHFLWFNTPVNRVTQLSLYNRQKLLYCFRPPSSAN